MAKQEAAAADAPAARSGKKGLILIIVGVLLTAALGAGGAWFFLAKDQAQAEAEATTPVKKKQAFYVKLRTMSGKPSFVANFNEESGRQRFVQIYAEALTRNEKVVEELKKHMPMVVHQLSTLFSNQQFRELQTVEGREALRVQATQAVQAVLAAETGDPGIEQVFFTNLVMQ